MPGPETPEDAWMWEGRPAGPRLDREGAKPGEPRFYMGDDGHGPSDVALDRAWPPGDTRTWPPSDGARPVSARTRVALPVRPP